MKADEEGNTADMCGYISFYGVRATSRRFDVELEEYIERAGQKVETGRKDSDFS